MKRYIVVNSNNKIYDTKTNLFLNNNVGQIVCIIDRKTVLVKFKNILPNNQNLIVVDYEDALYISNIKTDCETYLSSEKYNL